MINYIWFVIIVFGILYGIFTGRGDAISKAIVSSSESTVELIISILGIMCFWCGMIKIAEKSGITSKIAKVLRPILKKVFSNISDNEEAMSAIIMNLTTNMMGLSNAATPFGIKAMDAMEKRNRNKGTATNDMALFLVLNATCIQLVPTTVISIRAAAGSKNPGEIILPAIITTFLAAVFGAIYCKILQRFF